MATRAFLGQLGLRTCGGQRRRPPTPSVFLHREAPHTANLRCFSDVARQSSRATRHAGTKYAPCVPLTARSYWWSSSKHTTPSSTAADAPMPPPPLPEASTPASESISPAADAAQPPINVDANAPDPAILHHEASPGPHEVLPSAPLDTSLPDAGALADAASSIPPLQIGDLAELGLVHWTPKGLMVSFLEALNVFTGLPWFWTVCLSAVLARLVVLPYIIKSTRASAPIKVIMDKYQPLLKEAAATRDPVKMQRVRLDHKAAMRAQGVRMLDVYMTPIVQLPIGLGLFWGLKSMCELPVRQLQDSGFWLIPDLTAYDTSRVLPFLFGLLVAQQLKMMGSDLPKTSPVSGHHLNIMAVGAVAAMTLTLGKAFPIGVIVSGISGMLAVMAQQMLFRLPKVRARLRLPPRDPRRMPTIRETFTEHLWPAIEKTGFFGRPLPTVVRQPPSRAKQISVPPSLPPTPVQKTQPVLPPQVRQTQASSLAPHVQASQTKPSAPTSAQPSQAKAKAPSPQRQTQTKPKAPRKTKKAGS